MRHRLTVERYTATRDQFGGEVQAWSELLSRRCSVEYSGGREFLNSQQEQTQLKALFRVRHDSATSGITPKDRIVFDGEYWDIETVINTRGRNSEIQIMAVRGSYDQ